MRVRLLVPVVSGLMALALAGCGESSAGSTPASEPATTTAAPSTVAVVTTAAASTTVSTLTPAPSAEEALEALRASLIDAGLAEVTVDCIVDQLQGSDPLSDAFAARLADVQGQCQTTPT